MLALCSLPIINWITYWGCFGGVIWRIWFMLSIVSAGKAGFIISHGLGQENAMIVSIWGIVSWKEFRDAPPGTSKFLFFYVCLLYSWIETYCFIQECLN